MIDLNRIYNEDCMEGMKRITDESVDFILTDPPYGTIKGMKLNSWKDGNEWDVKPDLDALFKEYFRILKPGGKAVIFSQNSFTQEVRAMSSTYLKYNYPLIWLKNSFANYMSVNKSPVQFFEDMSVFSKQYGLLKESRSYCNKLLDYIGLTRGEINKALGHDKCDHFFRTESLQFSNISEEGYKELVRNYKINEMFGFLQYDEWLELYNGERKANRAKTAFNIREGQKYVSNIFEVSKESKRYHPTQKPVELLEQLIEIYTEPDAIILDTFMGSASTAISAINTNRNFIGFEMDEAYFKIANERIVQHKIAGE